MKKYMKPSIDIFAFNTHYVMASLSVTGNSLPAELPTSETPATSGTANAKPGRLWIDEDEK